MAEKRTEKPEAPTALWMVRSVRGSHIVTQPTEAEAIVTYRGLFIVGPEIEVTATPHEPE